MTFTFLESVGGYITKYFTNILFEYLKDKLKEIEIYLILVSLSLVAGFLIKVLIIRLVYFFNKQLIIFFNYTINKVKEKYLQTKRLTLVSQPITTREETKKVRRCRKPFSKENKRILYDWIYNNFDNQYPSNNQKRDLSFKTQLDILQIEDWFANQRCFLRKKKVLNKDHLNDWYINVNKKLSK